MSELDDSTINNTSLLKKLTGNKEPIRAEYKNKGNTTFINYAKIIMSTNVIPDTADKTDGFFRRWLIVDFPNKFESTNGNVLDTLTKEDYEALAHKCINILKELLKKSTFTNLGTIKERKQRYEDKSNPLKRFIAEKCIVSQNVDIPVFEFFDYFSGWLGDNGYRNMTKSKLSRKMKEMGFEVDIKHNPEVNKSWRYYTGIDIKKELTSKVKVYNKETKEFEEIKEFRDIEYNKDYEWKNICNIFKSYSEEELKDIITSWKKQGAVTEVRSGIYRFENNQRDEVL